MLVCRWKGHRASVVEGAANAQRMQNHIEGAANAQRMQNHTFGRRIDDNGRFRKTENCLSGLCFDYISRRRESRRVMDITLIFVIRFFSVLFCRGKGHRAFGGKDLKQNFAEGIGLLGGVSTTSQVKLS